MTPKKIVSVTGTIHDNTVITEGSPDKSRLITMLINANDERHPELSWISFGSTPDKVRALHRSITRGHKIRFDAVKSKTPIGPDRIPQLGAFAYTVVK